MVDRKTIRKYRGNRPRRTVAKRRKRYVKGRVSKQPKTIRKINNQHTNKRIRTKRKLRNKKTMRGGKPLLKRNRPTFQIPKASELQKGTTFAGIGAATSAGVAKALITNITAATLIKAALLGGVGVGVIALLGPSIYRMYKRYSNIKDKSKLRKLLFKLYLNNYVNYSFIYGEKNNRFDIPRVIKGNDNKLIKSGESNEPIYCNRSISEMGYYNLEAIPDVIKDLVIKDVITKNSATDGTRVYNVETIIKITALLCGSMVPRDDSIESTNQEWRDAYTRWRRQPAEKYVTLDSYTTGNTNVYVDEGDYNSDLLPNQTRDPKKKGTFSKEDNQDWLNRIEQRYYSENYPKKHNGTNDNKNISTLPIIIWIYTNILHPPGVSVDSNFNYNPWYDEGIGEGVRSTEFYQDLGRKYNEYFDVDFDTETGNTGFNEYNILKNNKLIQNIKDLIGDVYMPCIEGLTRHIINNTIYTHSAATYCDQEQIIQEDSLPERARLTRLIPFPEDKKRSALIGRENFSIKRIVYNMITKYGIKVDNDVKDTIEYGPASAAERGTLLKFRGNSGDGEFDVMNTTDGNRQPTRLHKMTDRIYNLLKGLAWNPNKKTCGIAELANFKIFMKNVRREIVKDINSPLENRDASRKTFEEIGNKNIDNTTGEQVKRRDGFSVKGSKFYEDIAKEGHFPSLSNYHMMFRIAKDIYELLLSYYSIPEEMRPRYGQNINDLDRLRRNTNRTIKNKLELDTDPLNNGFDFVINSFFHKSEIGFRKQGRVLLGLTIARDAKDYSSIIPFSELIRQTGNLWFYRNSSLIISNMLLNEKTISTMLKSENKNLFRLYKKHITYSNTNEINKKCSISPGEIIDAPYECGNISNKGNELEWTYHGYSAPLMELYQLVENYDTIKGGSPIPLTGDLGSTFMRRGTFEGKISDKIYEDKINIEQGEFTFTHNQDVNINDINMFKLTGLEKRVSERLKERKHYLSLPKSLLLRKSMDNLGYITALGRDNILDEDDVISDNDSMNDSIMVDVENIQWFRYNMADYISRGCKVENLVISFAMALGDLVEALQSYRYKYNGNAFNTGISESPSRPGYAELGLSLSKILFGNKGNEDYSDILELFTKGLYKKIIEYYYLQNKSKQLTVLSRVNIYDTTLSNPQTSGNMLNYLKDTFIRKTETEEISRKIKSDCGLPLYVICDELSPKVYEYDHRVFNYPDILELIRVGGLPNIDNPSNFRATMVANPGFPTGLYNKLVCEKRIRLTYESYMSQYFNPLKVEYHKGPTTEGDNKVSFIKMEDTKRLLYIICGLVYLKPLMDNNDDICKNLLTNLLKRVLGIGDREGEAELKSFRESGGYNSQKKYINYILEQYDNDINIDQLISLVIKMSDVYITNVYIPNTVQSLHNAALSFIEEKMDNMCKLLGEKSIYGKNNFEINNRTNLNEDLFNLMDKNIVIVPQTNVTINNVVNLTQAGIDYVNTLINDPNQNNGRKKELQGQLDNGDVMVYVLRPSGPLSEGQVKSVEDRIILFPLLLKTGIKINNILIYLPDTKLDSQYTVNSSVEHLSYSISNVYNYNRHILNNNINLGNVEYNKEYELNAENSIIRGNNVLKRYNDANEGRSTDEMEVYNIIRKDARSRLGLNSIRDLYTHEVYNVYNNIYKNRQGKSISEIEDTPTTFTSYENAMLYVFLQSVFFCAPPDSLGAGQIVVYSNDMNLSPQYVNLTNFYSIREYGFNYQLAIIMAALPYNIMNGPEILRYSNEIFQQLCRKSIDIFTKFDFQPSHMDKGIIDNYINYGNLMPGISKATSIRDEARLYSRLDISKDSQTALNPITDAINTVLPPNYDVEKKEVMVKSILTALETCTTIEKYTSNPVISSQLADIYKIKFDGFMRDSLGEFLDIPLEVDGTIDQGEYDGNDEYDKLDGSKGVYINPTDNTSMIKLADEVFVKNNISIPAGGLVRRYRQYIIKSKFSETLSNNAELFENNEPTIESIIDHIDKLFGDTGQVNLGYGDDNSVLRRSFFSTPGANGECVYAGGGKQEGLADNDWTWGNDITELQNHILYFCMIKKITTEDINKITQYYQPSILDTNVDINWKQYFEHINRILYRYVVSPYTCVYKYQDKIAEIAEKEQNNIFTRTNDYITSIYSVNEMLKPLISYLGDKSNILTNIIHDRNPLSSSNISFGNIEQKFSIQETIGTSVSAGISQGLGPASRRSS